MTGSAATRGFINFEVIAEPLDSLLKALANKIDREWPAHLAEVLGARELFLLTLQTADVTCRSIRWLCADKPVDPLRIPEFCISVPPLNRTILDSVFTAVFLLEDLPERCNWYHKASWREMRLELDRYRAQYGKLDSWQEWFTRSAEMCTLGARIFQISAAELADPASIPKWPNPGKMIRYGTNPELPVPATRKFMKYLNDWFYADLSQQAHLGGAGIMKRSVALLYHRDDPERAEALLKNKRAWVGQTVVLLLALASELEAYFEFGLRERIRYLWTIMAGAIVIAQELYETRYAELLA